MRLAHTLFLPFLTALVFWGAGMVTAPQEVLPRDRMSPVRVSAGNGAVVTLVGTSLTAATTWPEALELRLAECIEFPVMVQRVARPGATSAWGLERLPEIIATAPDLVFIEFAINDADLRIGHSLTESRRNHAELIRALREAKPAVAIYLMTTNPALGALRKRRPLLAAHYESYHELATELQTGVVDIRPRWQGRETLRQDLPDGLHPTDESAGAVIVPALAPLIAKTFGADDAPC